MFKPLPPSVAALIGLLACARFTSGCARQEKHSALASRAAAASGEMTQAERMKAKVEAVDPVTRAVTLRDEDGKDFMVLAASDVDVAKFRPGQDLGVTYQESLAFELLDPESEAARQPGTIEQDTRREAPEGVQFRRQIRTTVEIIAIRDEGSSATFRSPEGDIRTVRVEGEENQHKVAKLRPGDAVQVSYTEVLALAADE